MDLGQIKAVSGKIQNMPARARMGAFPLFVILSSAMPLAAGQPKTYPLHGTVSAMQSERVTHGSGVYTDQFGKTHGGQVVSHRVPIYSVHTPAMDYEIEGRRWGHRLSVGDEIDFRMDKGRAYVRDGDKEDKFMVVGQKVGR
jgi:hypothetical protein